MARRLKVLISAYACEPGKGSEPEVGWQWAMQMAKFHEVTVLTRANNRGAIEQALAALRKDELLRVPNFVYHDRDPFLLALKKRFKVIKLYYLLWQRSAHDVVRRLNELREFDLMHHVTFAAFRYPTAIWGHGVPVVWGPVGGITAIPFRLLPWRHPRSLAHELLRTASNMVQAAPFFSLPARARASAVILASTAEMQQRFSELGFASEVMPAIGLETRGLSFKPRAVSAGPLKLLFVGKVITLKGIDLALDALQRSETDASLTVIGDGNYLAAARRQAENLGLRDRVIFEGQLPREQVLAKYSEFDVFIFPSLHDTGGHAVIEAMFYELPVICLHCEGPAVAVDRGCGIRVPLGSRPQIVSRLAMAIRFYDKDRVAVANDGQRGRARVLEQYDWEKKGMQMEERYERGVAVEREQGRMKWGQFGFGRGMGLLNLLFSLRGVLMACAGLLLVGTLFFLSLGYLKKEAQSIVVDTLPGISYAGEANASLSQAFDRTLLLLLTGSAEQRAKLEKEIESFSDRTTAWLEAYKGQIRSGEDRGVFDKVLARRSDYLRIREETVKFVNANQREAAVNHCKNQLLPAFKAYKEEADNLLAYEMKTGRTSGESIMRICTGTQILVAVIGVLIFIAGFLIGISR